MGKVECQVTKGRCHFFFPITTSIALNSSKHKRPCSQLWYNNRQMVTELQPP